MAFIFKYKRVAALLCLTAILLCACGQEEKKDTQLQQTEKTLVYEETDYFTLPDEDIVSPEGMLEISMLQRDREGRLAMYIPGNGMDEGDFFGQITEYALTSDGQWEQKKICEKSITKRVNKILKTNWTYTIPYVVRGDDGELYALLQQDWPEYEEHAEGDETLSTRYSVLQLDEESDQFYEVSLRLDDTSLEGIDTSSKMLTKFHVLEDGTLFFVFGNRTAIQFDADNGSPLAVCETIPDDAFAKNVCYGDKGVIYYSPSKKLLGLLDLETMTVSQMFGEELDESSRKREWYYDTHTEDWSMYGFNMSGLYAIRQSGNKASIQRVSREGAFQSLEEATLYDVQVDGNKNVYVLTRRRPEESYEYQNMWEFGIIKFAAKD